MYIYIYIYTIYIYIYIEDVLPYKGNIGIGIGVFYVSGVLKRMVGSDLGFQGLGCLGFQGLGFSRLLPS